MAFFSRSSSSRHPENLALPRVLDLQKDDKILLERAGLISASHSSMPLIYRLRLEASPGLCLMIHGIFLSRSKLVLLAIQPALPHVASHDDIQEAPGGYAYGDTRIRGIEGGSRRLP
jgi:hypothetical protein